MLAHHSTRSDHESATTRHWLSDDYFDLILWIDADQTIRGFQLCYDKPGRERAFTWTTERGFEHHAVDGGESLPTKNCAPVLVIDGPFPAEAVRREFEVRGAALSTEIRELVLGKIGEYANPQESPPKQ